MYKTLFDIKIDFEKSYSSYLYDKKTENFYLDFFSMYSSLPLGYNHSIFNQDFEKEILKVSKIKMANNLYESDEYLEFVNIFKKYLFSDNIHFCSTGALAIESALKSAMHYKKVDSPMVISVKNSFHGVNSWGFTTDMVGINKKRLEFFPRNNWIQLNLDEIINYLGKNDLKDLVAILIEPIQCTNGDIYLDIDKLKIIKELCTKNDICFILDEIQTGFGTTGKMWYYEHMMLIPDILVFGKKSQVSGICLNEKYSDILKNPYQKLDVTFDGDLVDIIRAKYVLKAYEDFTLLEKVNVISQKVKNILLDKVLNYRSCGFLIAFDFNSELERNQFHTKCILDKVLINKAGEKAIRIRPNLAVTDEEVNNFLEVILRNVR